MPVLGTDSSSVKWAHGIIVQVQSLPLLITHPFLLGNHFAFDSKAMEIDRRFFFLLNYYFKIRILRYISRSGDHWVK